MVTRYLVLLLLLPLAACTQQHHPRVTEHLYKIGDDSLSFTVTDYGGRDRPVYINLHDDERTSLEAALPLIEKHGGLLLKFNNNGERAIRFTLDSAEYVFDPNRIFSKNGIVHTLIRHKRISNKAINELEKFAGFVLDRIPANPVLVIALHNNINGSLSIDSYTARGDEAHAAAAVSKVRSSDPDDFIFTTDPVIYSKLRRHFNTVLQHTGNAKQDGSLSIYFGEKRIPYVNCEAEHGHLRQADRMLRAIHETLRNGSSQKTHK